MGSNPGWGFSCSTNPQWGRPHPHPTQGLHPARKLRARPGPRSSAAQLRLPWEGAGAGWGVASGAGREIWGRARMGRRPRAWRDNLFLRLGPGSPRGGRAEQLHTGARRQGRLLRDQRGRSREVSSSCMCVRVLAARQAVAPDARCPGSCAERFQETARPSAVPTGRMPGSESTGAGSPSPRTGPVTHPSGPCLAPCGVQPLKYGPARLRPGAGQGCLGP